MAGHNKWSKVKRLKAVSDSRRSKIYTKLLKEIQVSAKLGGVDPSANSRLARAIDAARAQSIPNDTIEKSVKRGSGDVEGAQYEEVLYEGYGPGGVGLIIKALTDNKTRTVAEVRLALSRNGGNLAATNAVAYQFSERGVITIPKKLGDEEKIMELALGAGADDLKDEGEEWEVLTSVAAYPSVFNALKNLGAGVAGEITMLPHNMVALNKEHSEKMIALFEELDELDDVQNFYSNADFAE